MRMAVSQDPLPGRSALVLYGSETGCAQDVAEELGRLTERLRFATHVSELNDCSLTHLLNHSIVLFAISTTGQGDLPANAQSFWKSLRNARLRPGCLQKVNFVSFGLGDSSYPQYILPGYQHVHRWNDIDSGRFNWAHRKLYNRLVQLGANPFYDRGESDEQHPEGIDGSYLPWSIGLYERIWQEHPLPEGVSPIPTDVLLRPKWELQYVETAQVVDTSVLYSTNGQPDTEDEPDGSLLFISNAQVARVESNERVTSTSHWQDVRHLTLSTSPVQYSPGDVLTIYPKNFPSDVAKFLDIMKWTSFADKPLAFRPTMPQQAEAAGYPPPPVKNIDSSRPLTLRILLINHLDIMSVPRRSFFATLAHFTNDPFQHDRLLEFTNPEYLDELYDYTTRPRRSILEVLQEFETVKVPWQSICSLIPVLRGRQFSIASGGILKAPTGSPGPPGPTAPTTPTSIELLIAIVKYRTVIKRIRQGVCTRYIASLRPGTELSVTLQRGSLNVKQSDISKPVVMVGPGTGVAPMRSLIYERALHAAHTAVHSTSPKDILFFGCRSAAADYFFAPEWASMAHSLAVHVAFSRARNEKVYVQDLVRQHAAAVYDAIHTHDGLVYVCGSSGKMPQAVREALVEVLQNGDSGARDDAERYLAAMEKAGRYKQETW